MRGDDDIAQPRAAVGGELTAEPALVRRLLAGAHPRARPVVAAGGVGECRLQTRAGMEPPEPAFALEHPHPIEDIVRERDDVVAHVDLAVVGYDHKRGARW